jgi:hypothetical protein
MVVFDGAARSPAYFYNEKIMCGLGKGLAETNRLNPEGRKRALTALKRFALLAKGMGIENLTVVATAAARVGVTRPRGGGAADLRLRRRAARTHEQGSESGRKGRGEGHGSVGGLHGWIPGCRFGQTKN